MFLSYECIEYLGYDPKTKKHSYLFKIIDSEFEEEVTAAAALQAGPAAAAKVYQKRGFSHPQIAKQIFLCLRYISKEYSWNMNDLISYNKKYNPELWQEYGQEINKFLLFS